MHFKSSAEEFGSLKALVAMAMLLALRIALSFATTIQVTENLKIGFTIFPTAVACMMFGPVPGMFMGAAADILGLMLKPTGAYFPGYTLDAMVAGMIYGIGFYKKEKISVLRVAVILAIVTLVVNMLMTTTWISIQYGVGDFGLFFRDRSAAWAGFKTKFSAIFRIRFIKNACLYPVNVAGVYALMTAVRRIPAINREFGLTAARKRN